MSAPCAHCNRRTWAADHVCRTCRRAERIAAELAADAELALTDGAWRPRGLVHVWIPSKPPTRQLDLSTLIACPTCHARIDQSCHTRSGHTTVPHANRLVSRMCRCGGRLKGQRRYCDDCRDEANRMNKKAWRQRRRQEAA